jgi:hypothetical protein
VIQITNVLAADPARGGEEAHGLAITAIEREGDPHELVVLAALAGPLRFFGRVGRQHLSDRMS